LYSIFFCALVRVVPGSVPLQSFFVKFMQSGHKVRTIFVVREVDGTLHEDFPVDWWVLFVHLRK